jgi:hypothetical protein
MAGSAGRPDLAVGGSDPELAEDELDSLEIELVLKFVSKVERRVVDLDVKEDVGVGIVVVDCVDAVVGDVNGRGLIVAGGVDHGIIITSLEL